MFLDDPSQIGKDFYKSLVEPKLMTIAGSKISNALENKSFVVPFMHLKLRREYREDHMKVERANWE